MSAEYGCFPIWRDESDGVTNLAPDDLDIPETLAAALNQWALRYEDTFDPDYPPDGGFQTDADERDFYAHGLDLANQLAEALGDAAEVTYSDRRTREWRHD